MHETILVAEDYDDLKPASPAANQPDGQSGSEPFLNAWYRTMKKGTFDNIAQIREVYRHADIVGECIIFNVGANKYRVVTKIYFTEQTLLIRFVMTHKEYDKDAWKKDCGG